MDNCYLLIAVAVLTSVSCSSGSQDQVITTSSGKTATLPCQIANQRSDLRSLYWRKDGTAIFSRTISDGDYTNGKYSVTDTSSLVIPDVTESDAGNYSCIAAFRKSSGTEESDVMQLYVIDISVSHCKDTGQEVDGCSCSINGSNITSLECSASGFPHPPVITWEEADTVIYQSSSVDLTRFRENITLTCKARDGNLKSAVENKTVCVYYAREVTSTGGSPVETPTTFVKGRAFVAVIIVLIIVLLLWPISCLAAVYKRKKAENSLEDSDEPPGKDIGVNDAGSVECVLMDAINWKNSKGSSVGDLPTSQPVITSIEDEIGDDDFSPKDCDQNGVMGDDKNLSLVGLVLLDDLRSAPEETKESIKAAAVALVVQPYKIRQSHVDPRVTIHSLLIDMNETLQRNVNTGDLCDSDAAFVDMVLQDLDRIRDERDRDKCDILIPKPEFQEVTDASQTPAYQGNRVIQPSFPMPAISSSMVAFNQRPSFLRGELQSSERAAISNAISRIIQDGLVTWHSRLRGKSYLNCSTDTLPSLPVQSNMASSMTRSMVACNPLSSVLRGELQSSEIAAICNAFSQSILDLLETGYSGSRGSSNCRTAFLLSSVSDSVVQTWQEEDEIPDNPSTAKLLGGRCRDSEESNNEHHDYTNA